jgi:uncharacterized damage-inducible protein DinB
MLYRSFTFLLVCLGLLLATPPASAQDNVAAIVARHLTISRDFTLKVADQMPDADYSFKLTPAQMSFAEQLVHLADDQGNFLGPLSTQKLSGSKPASMSKKDVMAFVRQSFDRNIAVVSKLTAAQISATYQFGGPMTGLELLMFALDHTTHHRAQAEMYLRAKGIKPADYQF